MIRLINPLIIYTVWTSKPKRFTLSVEKILGKGSTKTPNIQFIKAWKNIDSPIVTIMIDIIGSPIKGLKIINWIKIPKIVINTKVKINAK